MKKQVLIITILFLMPSFLFADEPGNVVDENDILICTDSSSLIRTGCQILDTELLSRSCVTLPQDNQSLCVERRLELQYKFMCQYFELHGFGISSNDHFTKFEVNSTKPLIVEGYGPFVLKDMDQVLSHSARFSGECKLILKRYDWDISSNEKSKFLANLLWLDQLYFLKSKSQSAAKKSNLIATLILTLNPNDLNNLLNLLTEELLIISNNAFSEDSIDYITSMIKKIKEYQESNSLAEDSVKNDLKILLKQFIEVSERINTNIIDLISSEITSNLNTLTFASEKTSLELHPKLMEKCRLFLTAERCL